jgi:hypothetical protein
MRSDQLPSSRPAQRPGHQQGRGDRRRGLRVEAMHLAQEGHAPQPGKGQHRAGKADRHGGEYPDVAVGQHFHQPAPQRGSFVRAVYALEVAGVAALGRVVAHAQPGGDAKHGRQRRRDAHHGAPAEGLDQVRSGTPATTPPTTPISSAMPEASAYCWARTSGWPASAWRRRPPPPRRRSAAAPCWPRTGSARRRTAPCPAPPRRRRR